MSDEGPMTLTSDLWTGLWVTSLLQSQDRYLMSVLHSRLFSRLVIDLTTVRVCRDVLVHLWTRPRLTDRSLSLEEPQNQELPTNVNKYRFQTWATCSAAPGLTFTRESRLRRGNAADGEQAEEKWKYKLLHTVLESGGRHVRAFSSETFRDCQRKAKGKYFNTAHLLDQLVPVVRSNNKTFKIALHCLLWYWTSIYKY